jgi:hypothetical protein
MDPEIYMIGSLHYVMIWYGVPLCNIFLDGPSIEMDDVGSCNLERGGGGGEEEVTPVHLHLSANY